MKSSKYMLQALAMPFIATAFSMACATATPVELTNARVAYGRASTGPAASLVPSDVHKAKTALDQAEQAFAEEKGSPKAIDLAYIAERTAQIAEARAEGATAENSTSKSKQEFGDTQQAIAKTTEGTLVKTREQLAEAERGQAQQAQQRQESDKKAAASEQRAVASEQQAKDANEALAKLAAKEEERGTVITLSGSVLFRTNDATLMPEAQTRLDQVASALVAKGHEVVVEGYTDATGSQATNMNLSQRRAESVRAYLVSRGFPSEKIQARGMGPDRPVADNASTEGRANNRRVEIVIAKNTSKVN